MEKKVIPQHVAIIMDGKRRWARERNLSSGEGQLKGYEKMKQSFDWFFLRGVKFLSFYAFPVNFWQRDPSEVELLFNYFREVLTEGLHDFKNKEYKIIFSGRLDELSEDVQAFCLDTANQTKSHNVGVVNICINYSGRAEMMDAVKKIIRNNLTDEQIHEGIIKKYLYLPTLPYPDVIIRTSGKRKLSEFLSWQSANSELIFFNKYWPDFEELDAVGVIEEYNQRLNT